MVLDLGKLFWDGPTSRGKPSKMAVAGMYAEQNGKCMYCGIKLPKHLMHADHKTPLAKGGRNTEGNFQLLCASCNGIKGGKLTDGEFRRAYKLTPARQAKGPPSRPLSRAYFDKITKERRASRAKRRQREDNLGFLF